MSSRAADVLVTVQRGAAERPFFFVVAAYRDVFAAAHLARALGPAWSLYALQPPAAARRHQVVLPKLADLVARYVTEVRRVQPSGPYRLGGYSSGGHLAMAVARELRSAGEVVDLVALFDGTPGISNRLTYLLFDLLRRFASPMRPTPRPGEPRPFRLFRSFLTDGGMLATGQALRGYRPPPYDASPVVMFVSQSRGLADLRVPTDGWERIVRSELSVEPVPGDHDSCMQPPNVAVLAERLRARLAPVVDRSAAAAPAAP